LGTSRSTLSQGLAVTPPMRFLMARRNMARTRFTRLFAASGVPARRSRSASMVSLVKYRIGMSPTLSAPLGSTASASIFSTISAVT